MTLAMDKYPLLSLGMKKLKAGSFASAEQGEKALE